eukprot:359258-Chlamydomonas_euryale.AAC.7
MGLHTVLAAHDRNEDRPSSVSVHAMLRSEAQQSCRLLIRRTAATKHARTALNDGLDTAAGKCGHAQQAHQAQGDWSACGQKSVYVHMRRHTRHAAQEQNIEGCPHLLLIVPPAAPARPGSFGSASPAAGSHHMPF